MLQIKIGLVFVLVLFLLILSAQNLDVIEVQLFTWNASISLAALVFLASATGLVVGFLLGRIGTRIKMKP